MKTFKSLIFPCLTILILLLGNTKSLAQANAPTQDPSNVKIINVRFMNEIRKVSVTTIKKFETVERKFINKKTKEIVIREVKIPVYEVSFIDVSSGSSPMPTALFYDVINNSDLEERIQNQLTIAYREQYLANQMAIIQKQADNQKTELQMNSMKTKEEISNNAETEAAIVKSTHLDTRKKIDNAFPTSTTNSQARVVIPRKNESNPTVK